jgi:uncharacterized protein YjbI with pentapeptide repeats
LRARQRRQTIQTNFIVEGGSLAQAPETKTPKKRTPTAASKLDAFDVSALERSLNDSATRVSTIWVSFLIFSLYLLTAAATVTHRQLFLAEPLKLPVLNIDLPLWGFFFLAPILFVILHVYVLLQVLLLARTAAVYNIGVERADLPPEENAALRQRLANTLFAQIFAGSPREREGWLGWLLKAMAWITLAIAPVLILLAFQFIFLPYHSHLVTWMHRFLIAAELAAAFVLWPLVLDARRDFEWTRIWTQLKRTTALPLRLLGPKDRRGEEWVWLRQHAIALTSCVMFVLVSLLLATFPGEPHVSLFTGQALSSVQCKRWVSERFDRLILPNVHVVDDEKLDKIENATTKSGQHPAESERTQNFSHRDLNCGIFYFADLRRADFGNASMQGAELVGARLQAASLGNAELQGANLRGANLQDVNLSGARLQGAYLGFTKLDLDHADISFVFGPAQLQGASLAGAELQGANLGRVQLQGAILRSTRLWGADLTNAQLQGAELLIAELQGANLRGAQLQGAELLAAKLQGVDLSGAQLQGANLGRTELKLALLSDVFLWRAKIGNCSDARMIKPRFDAAIQLSSKIGQADEPIPATPEAIAGFIERAVMDISGPRKDEVRERLRARLVADIKKEDLAAMETVWRECAANSEKVEQAEYDRQHADLLRDLFCDARTNQKDVAAGIIRNWGSDDPDRRDFFIRLARGLLGLDGGECAATKDLSDRTKEFLRKFVSTPAPAH